VILGAAQFQRCVGGRTGGARRGQRLRGIVQTGIRWSRWPAPGKGDGRNENGTMDFSPIWCHNIHDFTGGGRG
jgi:hypothetical protein